MFDSRSEWCLTLTVHCVLTLSPAVIRKDLILVDGALGSCKTEVSAGQQLQQLEPVSKGKGPRAVSLQVCGTQGVAIRKRGCRVGGSRRTRRHTTAVVQAGRARSCCKGFVNCLCICVLLVGAVRR